MPQDGEKTVLINSRPKKIYDALVHFIMDGGWVMLLIVFLILIVTVINLWT